MRTFLCLLLFCLALQSRAQDFKNALEYMEFIDEQQEDIPKRMWRYTKAIAHSRSDRAVENKREKLVETIEDAMKKISSKPGYEGDDFKKQVLTMLEFNKNLLNDDYEKIIDMKAVAEQSYDAMEAYMKAQEMADEKMEEVQKTYETNYYTFANIHNIQIIEGETDLGKKMAKSNEVFKYYKKMYLIYFKVFVNEIYLMDALNAGDVNGIQQNTNALSMSAEEGLKTLDTVVTYDGDKSLIETTKKSFKFFQDEADNKMPILIDFLVLNEDMQKSQEALDNTPKRKRTQEQIDKFNAMVNDFNTAVKTYNRTNADLNRNRSVIVKTMNEANQAFLSRHIPKD